MSLRSILGVIATAVVLFIWGSLYWGLNPLPYETWSQTANDRTAQAELRRLFPDSGVYMVPGMDHPPEARNELLRDGPSAFVFIDQDPPQFPNPPAFIWGFIQSLTVAGVLLVVVRFADSMPQRLRLACWAGLASVAIMDWSDIIWWGMAIDWKFQQALYHFAMWPIGAAVLSPFVTMESRAAREAA